MGLSLEISSLGQEPPSTVLYCIYFVRSGHPPVSRLHRHGRSRDGGASIDAAPTCHHAIHQVISDDGTEPGTAKQAPDHVVGTRHLLPPPTGHERLGHISGVAARARAEPHQSGSRGSHDQHQGNHSIVSVIQEIRCRVPVGGLYIHPPSAIYYKKKHYPNTLATQAARSSLSFTDLAFPTDMGVHGMVGG